MSLADTSASSTNTAVPISLASKSGNSNEKLLCKMLRQIVKNCSVNAKIQC